MTVVIEHPEATAEFDKILRYYEYEAREGTSDKFAAALRETVAAIVHDPIARPAVDDTYQRERVSGFPYDVIYRMLEDDRILIVAYPHFSRRPGYWKRRTFE